MLPVALSRGLLVMVRWAHTSRIVMHKHMANGTSPIYATFNLTIFVIIDNALGNRHIVEIYYQNLQINILTLQKTPLRNGNKILFILWCFFNNVTIGICSFFIRKLNLYSIMSIVMFNSIFVFWIDLRFGRKKISRLSKCIPKQTCQHQICHSKPTHVE